jgi:alkylation response protein AidB-like acyl-CoA dehydrogenase
MTVYAAEHDELRSAVRRLLEKSADSAAIRATIAAGGYDTALWRRISDELGLPGLAIAEERGGAGYGIVELAVVLEEIGRATLPSPFLSTVLAAWAVESAGPSAVAGDLLPPLAAGRQVAAVAVGAARPGWTFENGRVGGVLPHVPDGATADHLVLVAPGGGAVVDLHGPGVARSELETMDLTRGQARIALTDAPARPLPAPDGWAERMSALAAVMVACEQVGGAERVLEMSTAYAGERIQFGRPIGSFQAVKHLLADMLVELELARTVQQHAVGLIGTPGTGPAALDAAARSARVACSRAFLRLTSDAIRVHGGIGYTWEHDAHLYFRRARASAVLFGGGADDLDRLAVADDLDRLAVAAGLAPAGLAPTEVEEVP